MKKESFYFPHDYEPTSDPKIQALLGEYGGMGYGVFWRIVEMLHSASDHKIPIKDYIVVAIAKQMLSNSKQIQEIIEISINTCELFISDGKFLWSSRVNNNISIRQEISEKRALAGRKGGIAKQGKAQKTASGQTSSKTDTKYHLKQAVSSNC